MPKPLLSLKFHATSLLAALFLVLPAPLHAEDIRSFTGRALNVTVGVAAGVELRVRRLVDGGYTLDGEFDNVSLSGRVTGTGRVPSYDDGQSACAQGHECILFSGSITLGSDAGFADGTVTTFVLALDVAAGGTEVFGAYHVGPLPGFDFEQYGILDLDVLLSS